MLVYTLLFASFSAGYAWMDICMGQRFMCVPPAARNRKTLIWSIQVLLLYTRDDLKKKASLDNLFSLIAPYCALTYTVPFHRKTLYLFFYQINIITTQCMQRTIVRASRMCHIYQINPWFDSHILHWKTDAACTTKHQHHTLLY
jgi:hypothetical protein